MAVSRKVSTCLWFDGDGEAAARLYTALIPDSEISGTFRPSDEGPALIVEFSLGQTPYLALNGGPRFRHSEAASIVVSTQDQGETDRLWEALVADGGSESMCGWLKDLFGVSWQIVPEAVPRCLASSDRLAAERAMQALMGMRKIDIAALEAAYAGQ